jgi:hypothetical protein
MRERLMNELQMRAARNTADRPYAFRGTKSDISARLTDSGVSCTAGPACQSLSGAAVCRR